MARQLDPRLREILEKYFDRYHIPEPTSGCFLWTGYAGKTGYGSVTIKRRGYLAHRLGVMVATGCDIEPGKFVLHKCDNKLCCNPEHMFIGTQADNINDMMRKGRHNPVHGLENGRAKLSHDEIDAIRSDPRPSPQIAADLGLNPSYVWRIKANKRRTGGRNAA